MKHFAFAALAGGLVFSPFFAPALFAQGEHEEGMGPEHHAMAPEKLKEKLGLSDEQAKKVEAAHKAMQEASKPVREKRKQLMETLHDQVKEKAADGEIQSTLDLLRDNEKAMQDAHQKMKDDLSSVLTPTQKAKMVLSMMGGMKERMGERMKERRKDRKEHGDSEKKSDE